MPWNNWVGESRVHCSRVMMLDGRRHVYQNTWAELMEDEEFARQKIQLYLSFFFSFFQKFIPHCWPQTNFYVCVVLCFFVCYFPLPLKRKSTKNNVHYTFHVVNTENVIQLFQSFSAADCLAHSQVKTPLGQLLLREANVIGWLVRVPNFIGW